MSQGEQKQGSKALSHSAERPTKRWLLARLRSIRAGVMLIAYEIDELGISLANDYITAEHAAAHLNNLENLPVYFAAHVLTPAAEHSEAA